MLQDGLLVERGAYRVIRQAKPRPANWNCLTSFVGIVGLLWSTFPAYPQAARQGDLIFLADNSLSCSEEGLGTGRSGSSQLPDPLRAYGSSFACDAWSVIMTTRGVMLSPNFIAVNDGSVAPTGSPQVPHLLDSYATRPPWKVAGVDYAVGVPSSTVLKNPSTIRMSGVSIDTANHLIRVTGNNVTLDGYDFKGWGVYVLNGASNTTIKNSNFPPGSSIYADPSTSNVSVIANTFDHTGDTQSSAFVTLSGSENKIVQYNYMHDSAQHFVELNNGGTVNYSYNLIMDGGTVAGAHLNVLQMMGSFPNTVVSYNTIYQSPQAAGGELIQLADGGNGLIANNTIIAIPDASGNPSVSAMIHAQPGETGVVQNNYMYSAGAYFFFYPGSGSQMTYSGNIDMATGKTINIRPSPHPSRSIR
ncbi:hypothetical protein GWE18_07965 [Bradyrhizobium sp. CSA112]|uniref:right-handed parallel beta-helix repeat-containing protein n=1 Tax=Bradyrhizobium sp. CSA112 TaxID=2699170 RepID=UPI0023AF38B5|nr:right-handed parallel beta-helix repeat-containing protein [Bradyrhizobium sp. CSA112]MDE5452804.1 hypothetical protein [Bradyrhizobium sp. CSA112]